MLVSLGLHHANALEAFLCDFDPAPDELHGYFCDREATIAQAVRELTAWGRGEDLPWPGGVPCSTWFWEADRALQGVINVRHRLNPQLEEWGGHIGYCVARSHRRSGVATRMLAAVLEPCHKLGIERALLTCDSKNPASWRAIEANGGVLEREDWCERAKREQRWYWIQLG